MSQYCFDSSSGEELFESSERAFAANVSYYSIRVGPFLIIAVFFKQTLKASSASLSCLQYPKHSGFFSAISDAMTTNIQAQLSWWETRLRGICIMLQLDWAEARRHHLQPQLVDLEWAACLKEGHAKECRDKSCREKYQRHNGDSSHADSIPPGFFCDRSCGIRVGLRYSVEILGLRSVGYFQ